jgi:hypothetical protein
LGFDKIKADDSDGLEQKRGEKYQRAVINNKDQLDY